MKGKNLFFSLKFSKLLDEWLSECTIDEDGNTKRRTQKDFAEMVGLHPNMISRYRKGNAYPGDDQLSWIAQALNVDVSEFIPTTDTERLAFDENYRTNFYKDILALELGLVESIGIDKSFWWFFTEQKNIYDIFPFEKANNECEENMIFGKKNSSGKKVGFTKEDLEYVKYLQEEVETFIFSLLIKKHIEKERGNKNNGKDS